MTRGDQLVERAADRLDAFARQAAGEPGLKGKLAKPLSDDARLLRGMRPSRIAARFRGEPDGDSPMTPAEPVVQEKPQRASSGGGPNPIILAVGAFAVGLLIAKVVDWRSHAHPR
jgi:hypothetical protein